MAIPPPVPTRMTSGCWKVDSAGVIRAPMPASQLFQRQMLYVFVRMQKYCKWSILNGNHCTNARISYISFERNRGRIEFRIDDFTSTTLLVLVSVIDP